jgi:hypothetical protein
MIRRRTKAGRGRRGRRPIPRQLVQDPAFFGEWTNIFPDPPGSGVFSLTFLGDTLFAGVFVNRSYDLPNVYRRLENESRWVAVPDALNDASPTTEADPGRSRMEARGR